MKWIIESSKLIKDGTSLLKIVSMVTLLLNFLSPFLRKKKPIRLLETVKSNLTTMTANDKMFELMSRYDRIEYAISIKHWCDNNLNAGDDKLRSFLERIEDNVQKKLMEDRWNQHCDFSDRKV